MFFYPLSLGTNSYAVFRIFTVDIFRIFTVDSRFDLFLGPYNLILDIL